MNRLLALSSIIALMFITALNAQNFSKVNKSFSTKDKEETTHNSIFKSKGQETEKQSQPEKEQAVQPKAEQPVKDKPVQQEKEKQPKPKEIEKIQPVYEQQPKPIEPQSYKPAIEPTSQRNENKPIEPDIEQPVQANPFVPARGDIKFIRLNHSESVLNEKDPPARLTGQPFQTETNELTRRVINKPDHPTNYQNGQMQQNNPPGQAFRRPVVPGNNHPGDGHGNNHGHHGSDYHGGYGYPDNYGYYNHHRQGYGRHSRFCDFGGFNHYGYCYGGLNIIINWQNDDYRLRGYLVDNDWDIADERSGALKVNYNPFPFKDIHQHTANCPYGGYGILVKDIDGYYAFFHFDKKGNKLAAKLLNKTWTYNKKIRIEVNGDIDRTNQIIKVWTLERVSAKRTTTISRYRIEGIDIDTHYYYFGCDNHIGRFYQRPQLWARF